MDSPFSVGDLVETHKGARFWGEVATDPYLVPVSRPGEQPTEEWRCDVRAIAPDFEGTIHVYPASQLRLRMEPAREWRCFHCDEVFRTPEDALAHFGDHEGREPACLIDPAHMREMEQALDRYRAEDSDKDRELIAMQSRHTDALRREEERGYANALRDVGYSDPPRRFRHNKRGSEYVLLSDKAQMQAGHWFDSMVASVDGREVVVYVALEDASLWVRPKEEFFDGRFTEFKDGVDKIT